jgi:hypothetical protein
MLLKLHDNSGMCNTLKGIMIDHPAQDNSARGYAGHLSIIDLWEAPSKLTFHDHW